MITCHSQNIIVDAVNCKSSEFIICRKGLASMSSCLRLFIRILKLTLVTVGFDLSGVTQTFGRFDWLRFTKK